MKMKVKIILGFLVLVLLSACDSETHEEKMAREKQEKQERAELVASGIEGVGNALSGAGSDAAESLTKGVTDMVSGIGRGIEKGTEYPVSVHEKLAGKGVTATVATRNMSGSADSAQLGEGGLDSSVSVYITFDEDIDTLIQIRAYDKDGVEVGRSNKMPVIMDADDGTYLHFSFDGQTPLTRVTKMTIYEVKKPGAADQAAETPAEAPAEADNSQE